MVPTLIELGRGDDSLTIGTVPVVFDTNLTTLEFPHGTPVADTAHMTAGASAVLVVHGDSQDSRVPDDQAGDDRFEVNHNTAEVFLFGDAGDDAFIVNTFLQVVDDGSDRDGDPSLAGAQNLRPRNQIAVDTGDGDDKVSYVQNAPLSIDGGAGIDTVVIKGTAASDNFVIQEDFILGAGIITTFVQIERIEVDGGAGDDQIYVLGTSADVEIIVRGGSGDDQFHLGGQPPLLYFDRPAFIYYPRAYTVTGEGYVDYTYDTVAAQAGTILEVSVNPLNVTQEYALARIESVVRNKDYLADVLGFEFTDIIGAPRSIPSDFRTRARIDDQQTDTFGGIDWIVDNVSDIDIDAPSGGTTVTINFTIPAFERRYGNRVTPGVTAITPSPVALDPPPFVYLADAVFDVSDFAGRLTVIGDEAYEVNGDGNDLAGDELIVHDWQSGAKSVSLASRIDTDGNLVYGIGGVIDTGIGSNNPDAFYGIEYESLERVELRMGDAADSVVLEAISEGTFTELVLGDGDDFVQVNVLGGGVSILGGGGSDTVRSSDALLSQANTGTVFSFDGDLHRREELANRLTTDDDYTEFIDNPIYVYVSSENSLANSSALQWPDDFGVAVAKLPSDGIATSERQQFSIQATGGTYRLSLGSESTNPIAYDAADSVIAAELNGLSSVPAGSVSVTADNVLDQTWNISFGGTLTGVDVAELVIDYSKLTIEPPGTVVASVTTIVDVGSLGQFVYAPEQRDRLIYSNASDQILINGAVITADGRIAEDLVQERGVQERGVQGVDENGALLYYDPDSGDLTTTASPYRYFVTEMAGGDLLYLRDILLADGSILTVKTNNVYAAKRAVLDSSSLDIFGVSGIFALQASNGQIVSGANQPSSKLVANAMVAGPDQTFTIIPQSGANRVAAASHDGGGREIHFRRQRRRRSGARQ